MKTTLQVMLAAGAGFLLAIAISGCDASVGKTRLGPVYAAKSEGCHLDVYTDSTKITRPYEELCLIDARASTIAFHERTMSAAIDEARPAACECGADAIIFVQVDTEGRGTEVWGVIVKAIRYKDSQ